MLTKHEAARMMEVPAPWVDAMVEIGALTVHRGLNGEILIDGDEILDKGFVSPRQEAVSLAHVQTMLGKLGLH
jgi:hypothetical protein